MPTVVNQSLNFWKIQKKWEFDQNTHKNHFYSHPSIITDFKIKFGNDSKCKYTTIDKSYLGRLEKNLNAKRILHWKYIRIICMNGNDEPDTNARYQRLVN